MIEAEKTLDFLINRGYIEQVTHYEELKEKMEADQITFYVGIDPTADSLHIGHFMVLMLAKRLQEAGHRPILLIGGGTASIGDPSHRNDMRKMLSEEDLEKNVKGIKRQIEKFVNFEGKNGAILVNNKDWLGNLNYLEFMRNIGVYFNMNDMLRMEAYKSRLEKGLTFFEFGYMPLQAYDFLVLNEKHNCTLQMGGNDQWSNVIAGVDLIRKKTQKEAFGFTIKLLTKKDGTKMGKTAGGALWLDENKTTPFEFYQYWRNIDDEEIEKIFRLLTFEKDEDIQKYMSIKDINEIKKILAFKVTEVIHGTKEAKKAEEAAISLFEGGNNLDGIEKIEIKKGTKLVELLKILEISSSNGEAKKLIKGNAISINDEKISDINLELNDDLKDNEGKIIFKKGKNYFRNIILK